MHCHLSHCKRANHLKKWLHGATVHINWNMVRSGVKEWTVEDIHQRVCWNTKQTNGTTKPNQCVNKTYTPSTEPTAKTTLQPRYSAATDPKTATDLSIPSSSNMAMPVKQTHTIAVIIIVFTLQSAKLVTWQIAHPWNYGCTAEAKHAPPTWDLKLGTSFWLLVHLQNSNTAIHPKLLTSRVSKSRLLIKTAN